MDHQTSDPDLLRIQLAAANDDNKALAQELRDVALTLGDATQPANTQATMVMSKLDAYRSFARRISDLSSRGPRSTVAAELLSKSGTVLADSLRRIRS